MSQGNISDNTKKSVGIGMLGYGFMGKAHSNAYLKMPYLKQGMNYRPGFAAICGRNTELTSECASQFNYQATYNDWEELVNDPNVHILDNCTPDDKHSAPSIAAAQKGKHIICEKPLAMDVPIAKEMRDAVVAAGVKHMCCYNYRFVPAVRMARKLIEDGVIGDIYQFRARYLQQVGHNPDEVIENVWYASGTRSGILLGISSHIIDMARFVVGEIKSVSGLVRTFNDTRKSQDGETVNVDADEGNVAILEFANGAIGTLESSGVASGHNNQHAWEINGSKGSIIFDLEDLNHLQVYLADTPVKEVSGFANVSVTGYDHDLYSLILPPGHNAGWEYGHVHALDHFVDCVANDKAVDPYGATFEDGYRVQVIIQAIIDSSRSGERIEIQYE